jgi:hypothetical protein
MGKQARYRTATSNGTLIAAFSEMIEKEHDGNESECVRSALVEKAEREGYLGDSNVD